MVRTGWRAAARQASDAARGRALRAWGSGGAAAVCCSPLAPKLVGRRQARPGARQVTRAPSGPTDVCRGRAAPREDLSDRADQDPYVQPDGHVLEVIEVVPDLLHLLFERVRVLVADLRPARDPGPHGTPERVKRDRVARHLAQVAPRQDPQLEVRYRVRPGADQVHVALADVDELGERVE